MLQPIIIFAGYESLIHVDEISKTLYSNGVHRPVCFLYMSYLLQNITYQGIVRLRGQLIIK